MQTVNEEWRTIEDFPDYAVSSLGRVKRVGENKGTYKRKLGNILAYGYSRGYPCVTLSDGANIKRFTVHRLVLEAFIGPRPPGCQGHHKDGVKTHSVLENLEWVTASENTTHAFRSGLANGVRGETCHLSKLKNDDVADIKRMMVGTDLSNGEIAQKFSVHEETISRIRRGFIWAHVEVSGFSASKARYLKEGEVWLIKKLLASKVVTQDVIAKMFKVHFSTISKIAAGKLWRHVLYEP
jgi:predicted XRE-type DNA-binding protein